MAALRWRDAWVLAAIASALAVAAFVVGRPAPVEPPPPPPPLAPLAPDTLTLALPVRAGTTLGELLAEHGVSADAVRAAALPDHDLAKIRPDRELSVVYVEGHAEVVAVRYEVDTDRVVVVERDGETWVAHVEEVLYDKALGTKALTVTRSLWEDGLDAGLSPLDLLRIAKVFEYEVDFNTELRDGAAIAVVADVESAPGRRDRLADLHAIRLDNGGKSLVVVRHTAADGEEGWYHPDGTGTKRPFLRSPLEFSRVTSGFNPRRYHPVLKTTRAHNGTDLGAPTGTPVRAVADGVVEIAGTQGGHGKYVQLDHEGPWETSYSHLSKIRVKRGERVRQGQIVGEVGQTGLATGPHLHYQMWKDGRYVDPMNIDLPVQAPLPAGAKEGFEALVEKWVPMLDAAVTPRSEPSRTSPE